MRILYQHRTLGDGAEGIHISQMVSAFRELGHDVRVIGLAAKSTRKRAELVTGTRRLVPGGAEELAVLGCNILEYTAVRRALDDFRPHLLYKRHARNDIGAVAAAKSRGIPVALEVNCLYSSAAYREFEPITFLRVSRWIERRALSLASIVLAVSSPLAHEARRLGIGTVHVLPNGANPAALRPTGMTAAQSRAELGLPDRLTIGWAGIVRSWHGLDLLLEVLAHLPEAALLVIGDGPDRRTLESLATQRGLGERVVITGRVPHRLVPRYLAAVDIAVVANELTGVASPMKLLEYMAMGLSVVAPDLPNIRDVVTADVDGVLFRPRDGKALSESVVRLAGDPDLRRKLGANARAKIERERNWRRNAETVLNLVFQDRGLSVETDIR